MKKICKQCGKEFEGKKSRVLCSLKCTSAHGLSFIKPGQNVKEKNGQWKGDNVGKSALHEWVSRRKPKPDKCECCGQGKELLDLANISDKYKRNLDDWEYLCRRCHMIKDGRLKKAIEMCRARKKPEMTCERCGKKFKNRAGQRYCSYKCSNNARYGH